MADKPGLKAPPGVVASETKQDIGSDVLLEGDAALDLYLAELACSVAAISRQSMLLVQVLAEHAELLQELKRPGAPTSGEQPAAPDDMPPGKG